MVNPGISDTTASCPFTARRRDPRFRRLASIPAAAFLWQRTDLQPGCLLPV